MQTFQQTLGGGTARFQDQVAGAETHQTGHEAAAPSEVIPMYQPAHERYYLVTASLVCRERGLPDRTVDTGNEESVSFVLRRIVHADVDTGGGGHVEYGWFGDEWRPVQNPGEVGRVTPDSEEGKEKTEEQIPLFPQTYGPDTTLERSGGTRRLWAGLIPVARRETYESAPVRGGTDDEDEQGLEEDRDAGQHSLDDPRKTYFQTRVVGAFDDLEGERGNEDVTVDDLRGPFVYAALDLYEFLDEHVPDTASWVRGGDWESPRNSLERLLIRGESWSSSFPVQFIPKEQSDERRPAHWAEVLSVVGEYRDELNAGEISTEDIAPFSGAASTHLGDAIARLTGTNQLKSRVFGQLQPLDSIDELPNRLQPPAAATQSGATSGEYVVRCVYDRPNCPPSRTPVVSVPSRRFRLASFFDAEAPARAVNISLPSASIADLRKSSQSVTMQFTKELRNQAQRVQDLTLDALDEGKIGNSPGVNIGMICSLSIPIITICALILLLIIVVVLNIVFWWLPFFKICFPLPTGGD